VIEWSERNKDFCITTIEISDNEGVCEQQQNALSGEILTDPNDAVEKVIVNLSSPGPQFPTYILLQVMENCFWQPASRSGLYYHS
jgi:hypothetical protein